MCPHSHLDRVLARGGLSALLLRVVEGGREVRARDEIVLVIVLVVADIAAVVAGTVAAGVHIQSVPGLAVHLTSSVHLLPAGHTIHYVSAAVQTGSGRLGRTWVWIRGFALAPYV